MDMSPSVPCSVGSVGNAFSNIGTVKKPKLYQAADGKLTIDLVATTCKEQNFPPPPQNMHALVPPVFPVSFLYLAAEISRHLNVHH